VKEEDFSEDFWQSLFCCPICLHCLQSGNTAFFQNSVRNSISGEGDG